MATIVDLRPKLGPVRNQGPFRGTCLAFALTAVHDKAAATAPASLSVETLYWGAKQHDGTNGPGTTFEAANIALTSLGQPPEELWAYDPSRDDTSPAYAPPADAIDPASCFMATIAPIDITATAIRRSLEAEQPVAIGIPTWPGLRRPTGTQLRNPATGELENCRHAVVIVGYHTDTSEILLRNSWGTSWGDDGHAWIPEPFIEDHVMSAWQLEPIRNPTRKASAT